MNKKIVGIYIFLLTLLSSSCSDDSYLNVIPKGSTALASVSWIGADSNEAGTNIHAEDIWESVFHVSNLKESGLDFSQKLYLFESPDGFFGMAASVDDANRFESWLDAAAKQQVCQKIKEKRSIKYTSLSNSWLLAAKGEKLLLMGPTVVSQQAVLLQQMARLLNQDEDLGIVGTPMFEKLESLDGSMTMVAQTASLPEIIAAPLSFGAPKEAEPSQVLIAAEMSIKQGVTSIEGECFSFNKTINDSIKANLNKLGTYRGECNKHVPKDALFILALNGKGSDLLQMIRANKGFQSLLTGINTAIDMDKIIRSVGGDLVIAAQNEKQMEMYAMLSEQSFIKDVPYWKQSCPNGSQIVDDSTNRWIYKSSDTSFKFGIEGDMFFGKLNTPKQDSPHVYLSENDLPQRRFSLTLNLNSHESETTQTLLSVLKPFFGKTNKIVYSLK